MYVRSWNQISRYESPKLEGVSATKLLRALIRAHTGTISHTAHKYPMGTKAVAIGVILVLLIGFVMPFITSLFGCGFSIFTVTCASGSFASQGGILFVQAIVLIVFVYILLWVYHRT